jgi:hypothetical protein
MASSVFPAPSAGGKTMFRTSLTSGTSWTVPAGVTYVNVTLYGGGGGGGSATQHGMGRPGQMISSTLSTTPGASIAYEIGAAGSGGTGGGNGGGGGTTTFTGATSAGGGNGGGGGSGATGGTSFAGWDNGGIGGNNPGGQAAGGGGGGAGRIDIEYWA